MTGDALIAISIIVAGLTAILFFWPRFVLPTHNQPAVPAKLIEASLSSSLPVILRHYRVVSVVVVLLIVATAFLLSLLGIVNTTAAQFDSFAVMFSLAALWDGFYAATTGLYPVSDRSAFKLWAADASRSRRVGRVQIALALMGLSIAIGIISISNVE